MKIFHLPDLGEGLAEAEIREWYVKEGDVVTVDQPLLSMETAKAVVDVPSPYAGKIIKLFGKNGEMIQTHAPLIEFDGEGEAAPKDKGSVVGSLEESGTLLSENEMIIGSPSKTAGLKVMPAVRQLAKQLNVDLASVTPTGPKGQITAEDVKRFASEHQSGKSETLHGARLFMAKAMIQSHQDIVPVTLSDEADVTDLKNSDITYCVIQAIIKGVQAEPGLNAWFDGKTMTCHIQDNINLGLAVDTKEGLFVPVIKNVTEKSLDDIRHDIDRFKKSALDRSFTPEDFQHGTITLSNFGVFAGRFASLIIVPPMVAIIGCGKLREAALVRKGKIEVGRVLPISLTFDHRALTGGEAARFLSTVIKTLQDM